MFDAPVHIANERVKGLAGIAYNLSAALIAATAARVWAESGFDRSSFLWLFGAAALILAASKLLTLLQEEGLA